MQNPSLKIVRRKINTAWTRYNPTALGSRARGFQLNASAYWRDRRQRGWYAFVEPERFTENKISDMIFVFGSGASLRDVPQTEWAKIDQHNTLGWKSFAYQEYVHGDYLLLREFLTSDLFNVPKLRHELHTYIQHAVSNPRFKNAFFFGQAGWTARSSNELFGSRIAPRDAFRYTRYFNGARHESALPSESFGAGITHVHGTLTDAVNIAYLGGWQHIVLIGIDLYNSAYFIPSAEADHTHAMGTSRDEMHPTAKYGIVAKMGEWAKWLAERGVQISVHNPRSLMAEVMPVFSWDRVKKS